MGLKKKTLQKEIQDAIEKLLPNALEQGLLATMPRKTKACEEQAKKFGEVITKTLAKSLSEALASAIDYHVRSADIYGNLITNGSPSTHYCTINSPSPLTNGKTPNTLGIK